MKPPDGEQYFACPTCRAVITAPWVPGETYPWCVHANGNVSWHPPKNPTTDWTPMIMVALEPSRPQWDSSLPQDERCACGHPYYRHFDSYEGMEPVGCKYCACLEFVPLP